VTPAEATATPAGEPSRVTIEELSVPTVPPTAASRETPAFGRGASGAVSSAVAPTPAPMPAIVAPAAEPQKPAEAANPASRLERTVPFRTGESIPLGIVDRLVTIESVEVTDWPKPEDVRKAESKPADTTKLTVKFSYANRNDEDWKCQYHVAILDDKGKEIGSGEREAGLSGNEESDTNRVSVKLRTLDFPKASRLRVRVLARPD
jgi:hypothetical protein